MTGCEVVLAYLFVLVAFGTAFYLGYLVGGMDA